MTTTTPSARVSFSLPSGIDVEIETFGENSGDTAIALLQATVEICGALVSVQEVLRSSEEAPHPEPLAQSAGVSDCPAPSGCSSSRDPMEGPVEKPQEDVGDLDAVLSANLSSYVNSNWSLAVRPTTSPHWKVLRVWETQPEPADVFLCLLSFGGFEEGPEDAGIYPGFSFNDKSYSAWVDWRLEAPPDFES